MMQDNQHLLMIRIVDSTDGNNMNPNVSQHWWAARASRLLHYTADPHRNTRIARIRGNDSCIAPLSFYPFTAALVILLFNHMCHVNNR
jgi:hypothetical protein